MTHNVARQIPFQAMTAQAQLFAEAGPVRVAEARAEAFDDQVGSGHGYRLLPDDWQRRLIAMVDIGPDQFYCVDFYRIAGGQEHWWCFHAQEGDFSTSGLSLVRQQTGTLAGPDVPYGDPKWLQEHGCTLAGYRGWQGPMFGFAHLYNVERGRPEGVWSADWALKNADGLRLRLTVTSAEGAEVALCDGKSPAGGSPYEMKWVLLHREGKAPVKTQVVSVLEPYLHTPSIQEARPLKLSGRDEAGFAAAGCTVRLADRTDTLLAAVDGNIEHRAEGSLRFAGRFGFLSEQDGVPVSMVLVGGTRLTRGRIGIRLDSPEYRAHITHVDRARETITVAPAPPDPAALVGATLFITNPVRRIAYNVRAARAVPEGAELRLDLDSRVGTGRVTGVENFRVKTSTPFPLHRYRYYHGARLINADRTAEYRLDDARDKKAAIIDSQAHPDADEERLAREFLTGTWFDVYDYGIGDEVVWPYTVSVTRVEPGVYRVTAPVPVRVALPKGSRTERGR
jgi:hypothetical protein